MKILDWYILKKYLVTFFFCLVLLTVMVLVIDLSEKADDFAKTKLSFSAIIDQYYLGFIPRIDAMLFPLFVFIAVIFFTSIMANRSEVIAILSSGVSYRRFLRPYLFGSLFLGGMLWWANQSLVPKANAKWAAFDAKYIKFNSTDLKSYTTLSNYYFRLDSFSYAGIRYYDTTTHTGNNFFIQRFKNYQLVYNLHAETITWDTAKHKWKLMKVMERNINGFQETIVLTDSMKMNFNFKPRDFQRDNYMKDKMPTQDLNEFIQLERIRGSEDINTLLVERYTRDSVPLSVLILTFIGAIIASRKIRGGTGFHLAMGFVISILYILLSRFATVFSVKGNFDPLWAAWTPNLFFGSLVIYLYYKAPK
ncbi:MAG: LptF/LptG family permease [Ginsengibacter sp.]